MRKLVFLTTIAAIIALAFTACPESEPELSALTGTVSISGIAEVGQTLTAYIDNLGGSGTISFQWNSETINIGTNSNTYVVQSTDVGSTITVTVTCSGNSGSITSNPVTILQTPGLDFGLNFLRTGYSVSRGRATANQVVIPAFYNGLPVVEIGRQGFQNYTIMTSIEIPSSVTSIGDSAFSGCIGLTSVTIPSSVTFIGNSAFSGCSGLTSVTIPSSVTEIRSATFSGCSGLTSVTIPSSVTSIGDSAFSGCSGLTSVTIPNSVTSIGGHAFYDCSGLTSVTFQGGNIGYSYNYFWTVGSTHSQVFPGNLDNMYWEVNAIVGSGGAGTYTRPDTESNEWTKQD